MADFDPTIPYSEQPKKIQKQLDAAYNPPKGPPRLHHVRFITAYRDEGFVTVAVVAWPKRGTGSALAWTNKASRDDRDLLWNMFYSEGITTADALARLRNASYWNVVEVAEGALAYGDRPETAARAAAEMVGVRVVD